MDTVNTQTTGDQGIGTVAALDDGGYVIAWRGVAYGGQAIWFQRYDVDGATVGAETRAKDEDPAGKEIPELVAYEGGRFAVNGKHYDAGGIPTFGGGNQTLAQHYGRTPEGEHLSESDPRIAGLPGGGYVTVEPKISYVQNTYPAETFVVRWFNEAGQQQRQYERPLEPGDGGTTAATSTFGPAVIALADGKVLVTWEENYRRSGSAEFDLFSTDGLLLKHETVAFRGATSQVEATPLRDGGFVVSWAGSNYMASPEGYYQQYDAGGARVGETVNLGSITGNLDAIRVASTTTLGNGDVVLVFDIRRSDGTTDIVVEHLDDPTGPGEPPPPPPTGEGQVLMSDQDGDTQVGGAGNDTLNAGQGPDTLTGGGGGDAFVYADLPWNAGRATDFTLGSDRLDLSSIFEASGYTGSDPVADGRMRFDSDGAGGTRVYFDRDAPDGGDWPFLITTLDGVSPTGLTWAQLSGGGEPPPPTEDGQVLTWNQHGDTLTGGAGADTLNASQGSDRLTGGGGADHFAWAQLPWRAGHVTDFTPGSDKLDLRALFDASGYAGSNPIADGTLEFGSDGLGNTEVYFDRDASGTGDWPFLITTLDRVQPDQIGVGDWLA